jgi:hypothetical protein
MRKSTKCPYKIISHSLVKYITEKGIEPEGTFL